MSKEEAVQDDNIALLENEIFYNVSAIGYNMRLDTTETALALLSAAEDMIIYLKSLNLLDDGDIKSMRTKAQEFAVERQKKSEQDGTLDRVKELMEKAKIKVKRSLS